MWTTYDKLINYTVLLIELSLPLTVNTLKQISGTSPDKNSAHLQNNRRTHEHHELCCGKYNYKLFVDRLNCNISDFFL